VRLRSIVAIAPGEGLDDALNSPADALLLTLSDAGKSVSVLRDAACEALPRIAGAGKRALLSVNHPRTRLLRDDLDALVSPALAGVLLPHAVEPQDLRDLAVLLREFEYNRGIEPGEIAAFAIIDTARGLLRAADIAGATTRAGGLVFDANAYADDIGARHEESGPRLAYARGAVVAAARAHDALPLVDAGPLELLQHAEYGFAGAILRTASAAGAANTAFNPGEARLARARDEAAAYAAARAEGAWVARAGTTVVDAHRDRKARQLLD
jgi:citrate lyase subunit beta/citryl-CoA lyase